MTNAERELILWLKSEVNSTFYPVSYIMTAPAGGKVNLLKPEATDRVDCSSYHSALDTIERIISEALHAGIQCTRPEACAAAWSVPDGAPIAMALDNLGCTISDAAAERMESWAKHWRALRRRYG